MPTPVYKPKHFFLNERHELPPEKSGGGKQQPFMDVDWQRKTDRLTESFERIERRAASSTDPSTKGRFYILAESVQHVTKASTAKDAVDGRVTKKVSFAGEQSQAFDRLGLQLIEVFPNGTATVHAMPEQIARMRADLANLPQGNHRQQGQWVNIESFDWIPADVKFDEAWLTEIGAGAAAAHIKLQPFLTTFETDAVIRAIEQTLRKFPRNELLGKEVGYRGRFWLRATLSADCVRALAEEFAAIQAIHPPILAKLSGSAGEAPAPGYLELPPLSADSTALPCVGVVDTAVPDMHRLLSRSRRGIVLAPQCENSANDSHGSSVASRVVFGDLDFVANPYTLPQPTCSYFEVRSAAKTSTTNVIRIRAESVATAVLNVINSAPDVRVFNFSFDSEKSLDTSKAIPASPPYLTYFQQLMTVMADFDNLAFDEDTLLVIAAGNVDAGNIPVPGYPKHHADGRWQLHAYSRCFNALTCGGTNPRVSAAGLASEKDAPSPFFRLGPGFAHSPKPDFCAPAGNTDKDYRQQRGLGVAAISALGEPLEVFGTSQAAPLLAREAAFVLSELRRFCPPETRPYACTAKAILALTADNVAARLPSEYRDISGLALGYGRASAERLKQPHPDSALIFWQGFAERAGDKLRVRIPISREWLSAATSPQLRICIAWDTPVNSAVESWACRDVSLTLCATEESHGASGTQRKGTGYPLYSRTWDLRKAAEKTPPSDDFWIVEMSYKQIAAYAAGHLPTPLQRIAFAAELKDIGETPQSPQSFIQQIPASQEMTRFSTVALPLVLAARI